MHPFLSLSWVHMHNANKLHLVVLQLALLRTADCGVYGLVHGYFLASRVRVRHQMSLLIHQYSVEGLCMLLSFILFIVERLLQVLNIGSTNGCLNLGWLDCSAFYISRSGHCPTRLSVWHSCCHPECRFSACLEQWQYWNDKEAQEDKCQMVLFRVLYPVHSLQAALQPTSS